MRAVLKASLVWGAVGLGVAVLWSLLLFLQVPRHVGPVRDYLDAALLISWPAAFSFLSLENAGTTAQLVVALLAALTNFVLYFFVGLILTSLWKAGASILRRGAPPEET